MRATTFSQSQRLDLLSPQAMCVNRGVSMGRPGGGCQGDTSLAELSRPPSVPVNETGDILYV